MTEYSYPWSGAVLGDCGPYTDEDWSWVHRILAVAFGFEGVVPITGLYGLQCTTPGANAVNVNTGAAVVDGKAYRNSAVVPVTIPSAIGGGNTRIDRIVARCVWATQTVRIYRIAGVDAVSPVAPTISQISESTYDIYLYQALVNTSGTITLTDERTIAVPPVAWFPGNKIIAGSITTTQLSASAGIVGSQLSATAGIVNGQIADDTITEAKISETAAIKGTQLAANAAIAASQIANQVTKRQGGDASDWSVSGTNTYTPTSSLVQKGVAAGNAGSVTFPQAFSQPPILSVAIICVDPSDIVLHAIDAVTASGFTFHMDWLSGGLWTPCGSGFKLHWTAEGAA